MSGVWKYNLKVRRDSCSAVMTLNADMLRALGVGIGDEVQVFWQPGAKHITIRKRPEPCEAEYWDGKENHVCGNDDYTHECDHKCKNCTLLSWKRDVSPEKPKMKGSGDCGQSCDECKRIVDCSEFTNTHKEGGT